MVRKVNPPLYEHRRRGKTLDYFTPSGVEASNNPILPASGADRKNLNYSSNVALVDAISRIIMVKNVNRRFIKIQNNNTFNVRINYGVSADSNSEVLFASGGTIILDGGDAPVEAIHAISESSGSGLLFVVEGY